jgi:hypothetical protein
MTAQAELERLTALHDLEILDTPREERFDRVVRLAQRLFDVPMAAITLLDSDRAWVKASTGLDVREGPRCDAFCDRTIRQAGPFVITDAARDKDFATNPFVTQGPGIRFYAGQPLVAPGGQRIGSLCILDSKPREIPPAELSLLRDLADWVEKELSMDEEMLRASVVQRRLLPNRSPRVAGYEVAGRCLTARNVSGDFFDWFPVGDEFQVVLADVMGKGVAAALIGATVRAVIRGASRFNDLGAAIDRASIALEEDLADTETFVTLFCARLDARTHRFHYVDAGHGLSVVLRRDGSLERLAADGLPLGVGFGDVLRLHEVALGPGDALVTMSDGMLDFFPTTDDALEAARQVGRRSTTAEELVEQLCRFADGADPLDDVTVLAVRRLDQPDTAGHHPHHDHPAKRGARWS